MINKVVFIGSGNVATHLCLQMFNCGFEIIQVYSKTLHNATILANKVNSKAISNIFDIYKNADLYIISVSDSAIAEITQKLDITDKITVHTSGSTSINILNKFQNHGIIYPLQTFSKYRKLNFEEIL